VGGVERGDVITAPRSLSAVHWNISVRVNRLNSKYIGLFFSFTVCFKCFNGIRLDYLSAQKGGV